MSDWGKAHINNSIGFGQGNSNNTIGWGYIYDSSWSADTIISGLIIAFSERVKADGGTTESLQCINL